MDARTDDERNPERSDELRFACDPLIRAGEEPPLASHLVTPRMLYHHHGIYVGNGRVIHYAGLAHGLRCGPVEDVSLERFAHGHGIRIRQDLPRFDRREVVERARSRLGECSYRILTNNCEHLCAWALRGESRSMQVERVRAAPRAAWRAICCVVRVLDLLGAMRRQSGFGCVISIVSRGPRPDRHQGIDQHHRAIPSDTTLWSDRTRVPGIASE